ncbi:MAG: LamB/YcsF family protein [Candidatus Accumulibacter sp.]|nr:LamB/YcsF family protein [Accumulibacter sp.]
MQRLNLNSDLGESFGPWKMGSDAAMLRIVDSANVACGYHAGDPSVMLETVALARGIGVSVGAHPGFPDLQGFGRRRMDIPADELEAMLICQIGALDACCRAQGTHLTHVKAHGALYNIAGTDRKVADVIVRAVWRVDPKLILLAAAASHSVLAARERGLPVVEEIFADRAYLDDGNLVPRGQPGAMIHGAEASLAHVLRMVEEQALVSINGKRIPVKPQSICVHGDNAEAVATAQALRDGLTKAGHILATIPEVSRDSGK